MKNLKFNTLVRLYENEVYSLALYLLKNRSEAEDVAQEVYIRLWEGLGEIELTRAKYWLLRVTRNTCLDRLRRRTVEHNYMQQTLCIDPSPGPMDTLLQEQRSASVRAAIGSLDEPFRSLIVLRDIHQHSYRDIARILELGLDQVKVYLFRARQKLKSRLHESDL